MAKPITEVRAEKGEDSVLSLATSELIENLNEHSDDIKELVSLIEVLRDTGILSLIGGVAKNYRYILEELAGEISKDKNQRVIVNLLSIYSLLASIDTERLLGFVNNMAESVNSADKYRKEPSVGVLTLMSEMRDKDLSAGIKVFLNIMKGFSSQKKE